MFLKSLEFCSAWGTLTWPDKAPSQPKTEARKAHSPTRRRKQLPLDVKLPLTTVIDFLEVMHHLLNLLTQFKFRSLGCKRDPRQKLNQISTPAGASTASATAAKRRHLPEIEKLQIKGSEIHTPLKTSMDAQNEGSMDPFKTYGHFKGIYIRFLGGKKCPKNIKQTLKIPRTLLLVAPGTAWSEDSGTQQGWAEGSSPQQAIDIWIIFPILFFVGVEVASFID